MSNIVLTLSAQDAQFVQKMMQARAEAEKLGYAVELMDKKGKKTGQTLGDMLGGVTANLGKAALGFAGVGSAIAGVATAARLIMAEYEQMKSRRTEAAGAHIRLADSEAQLLQALGSAPGSMQLSTATKFLQQVAKQKGTDLNTLYTAAAGALSGRGTDITEQQSLESVRAAAGVSASTVNQTDLLSMASGIQELRKAFGGTAEQQAGMMLAMGAIHRSPDIASMTQHALPVVANAGRQFGMSEQQSMTALSVLSNLSGDQEGRMSATQFQQMAEQVFTSTRGVKSLVGKGFDERLSFIAEGKSKEAENIRVRLFGALSNMFAGDDRGLRRAMEKSKRAGFDINEFHGEAKTKLAALSFLDVNSPIGGYRKYRESMAAGEIPGDLAGGQASYEAKQRQLAGSNVQQAAMLQGSLRAATEQAQLANPGEAFRGVLMEQMPTLLRAMGQSSLAAKVEGLGRNMGKGVNLDQAFTEIDRELRGEQDRQANPFFRRLLRIWDNPGRATPGANIPIDPTQDPSNLPDFLNEEEKGRINQIQQMRRELHEIRQQQTPAASPAATNQQSSRQRVDIRQQLVVTDPYGRSINRNFYRSHPARALSS